MKTTIVAILILLTFTKAYAQEAQMRVTPKTCVALKKGQICYQTLRIHFTSVKPGNFCLKSSEKTESLKCWENSNKIDFRYRFASDKDIEFSMVNLDNQAVANARVTLVWVYKQPRKRNRWRLF